MAIAYRSSEHNYNASSSTLVITKPSGTTSGDVMLAVVYANTGTTSVTEPSGWTLIKGYSNAGGSFVWQSPFLTGSFSVWYKVAGGSEPADYTWTLGSAQRNSGGIMCFSGVDNATPINASEGATNSATPTVGAITTTVNDCMIVWMGNYDDGADYTWTEPSGFTLSFESATAGKSAGAYKTQITAGSTGILTPTLSTGTGNACFNIALAPATGGGGGEVSAVYGITLASVKTVNGITIANTKTILGKTTT